MPRSSSFCAAPWRLPAVAVPPAPCPSAAGPETTGLAMNRSGNGYHKQPSWPGGPGHRPGQDIWLRSGRSARPGRRRRHLRAGPLHRRDRPVRIGKSTLMHCMAGLDRPTSGQSLIGGLDIGKLDDPGLTQLGATTSASFSSLSTSSRSSPPGKISPFPLTSPAGKSTGGGSITWWASSGSATGWTTARTRCRAANSTASPVRER